MTQARTSRAVPLLFLLAAAAGGLGLLYSPGCKLVESTADSIAGATSGTPVGTVFSGIARTAESFRDYSLAEEHYIGRAVAVQILSQYKVKEDEQLKEYVNLVGLAVLAAPEAGKTFSGYHFIVLEGEEIQVVSTPGGFVFITEGAVKQAKDEDELAAVLAHEIAHVTLKHGIGAIKAATRKKSAALLVQGVGQGAQEYSRSGGNANQQQLAELTAAFGDTVQDIAGQLLVTGYSRDLELEADKAAAGYLQSSAYARSALASYLRGLAGEQKSEGSGWFNTHPPANDRVSELGELATGEAPGRAVRKQRFLGILGGG